MKDDELSGVTSTAKLGDHPIHPMLVPFPIVLFIAVFVSDLAFWGTSDAFWAEGALWLLGAGLVMSAAAAIAGFTDFFGNARIRSIHDAWQHMIGNVTVVVLSLVSLVVRLIAGATGGVLPWGLVLSLIVVLLLLFTGWKGGELVYHHRVGVHPAAAGETAPTESLRREQAQ